MRRARHYDVCASVISSDLSFDARVWKEARSLASDRRKVAVIGTAFDIERTQRRRDSWGVEICEIPLGWRSGKKSPARRLYALLRVWLEVLCTDASVYHAHDIHVVVPAWLASKLRRAGFVYDAHELRAEPNRPTVAARLVARGSYLLERVALRDADAVITTNSGRAQRLTERYGRTDIMVLANVPFLEKGEVAPQDPGFPPHKRVVLYFGRISAEGRAFRETIQALRHLGDDVDFVILGFGWPASQDQIRRWARDYGVERRVHLLPPLPFDDLIGAAAAATVGVVPLYGGRMNETLGDTNKLHEYLMGGLPVVASRLPQIQRVVTRGEPAVGELFDPFSPESIAQAIRAVIDDPRYPERRAQARKLAEEHFNWDLEQRKLIRLYGDLLGERNATPQAAVLEGS